MKLTVILGLLVTLLASCGHTKKDPKHSEAASDTLSFEENGQKFVSQIQYPAEKKDKYPLVVVIHEWWGRTPYIMNRAKMINGLGYASVAVDLYGDNKTVATPAEAEALATPFYQNPQTSIDRLNKYLAQIRQNPKIDSSEIYVIGYCFGGTQALNLARSGTDIKGVVSFHGGLTTTVKSTGIKAKVLAINGLADPMVPAKDRAAFEKEMKSLKANYKMVNYKDAKHAFTNPKATEIGKKYNIPIAYNKKADEGSWKDFIKFLEI